MRIPLKHALIATKTNIVAALPAASIAISIGLITLYQSQKDREKEVGFSPQ